MSMVEVAQATVTIIPNMKGSQEKIAKELSGVDANGAGNKISASLGTSLLAGVQKHAKAIGAVLAGVGVAKFASSCIDSFTDLASQTKSLQRVMGGTAEQVSGLMGAMKLSGMDVDKASTSLTIFSKKLEAVQGDQKKTAELSSAMGAAVTDASGKIRPMSELLPEVANRFASMEDGAEKTALACQLFGKSGTAMLPFLNKGAEGVAELTAKAQELGIVLDDSAMDKFTAYKSAIRGWQTALQGAQVTIGQSLTPFITMATAALTDLLVPGIQIASGAIANFMSGLSSALSNGGITSALEGIGNAFASAFTQEGADTATSFGDAIGQALNGVVPILDAAKPGFELLGNAIKFVSDNATWAVPAIGAIAGAFVALNIVNGISGPLSTIGNAIGGIAAKAFPAAAGTTALAGAETAEGAAAAGSVAQTLALGAAILMIGGGVALAGVGLSLMANAAISLASAGAGAVGIMLGMVVALVGLGAALVIAGPALTAAAPGALAFGAAVMMIGVGVGIAAAGISLLAAQLPIIAAYGMAAGVASIMLGAGLMVLGAGAMVAGAGCMVLGAGLAVAAPGLLVASAAAVVLGASMMLIGAGSMMAGAGFAMMASSLPVIASSAAPAAVGIGALAAACLAAVPGFLAGAGPCAALAAALVPMGAAGMMAGVGLMMVSASLPVIADNAQPAGDGMRLLAQAAAECGPSLSSSAPAFASIAGSVQSMAGATAMGATAMSSLSASAGMAAGALDSVQSASAGVGAASGVFSEFAASAQGSFSSAAQSAVTACASINRAINSLRSKTIKVNVSAGSVKLPHFTMTGSFNPQTGQVPQVSVRWYARGGIFTEPTFFRGVGEAGNEAVMPLEGHYMRPFAQAVAAEMDGGSKTVNNYNIRLAVDSSVGAKQITRDIGREIKMHGLMKG